MNGVAARQTRVPLAYDPGRGRSVLDALDPSLRGPDWSDLLVGAAGSSPYLARLIGRHGDWLAAHALKPPEDILAVCLAEIRAKAAASDTAAALMREIRVAKGRAAMITALADLAGAWDLNAVTDALTRTADTLCEAAAAWLLSRESAFGANEPGYCLLAMGKMGAGELNFSSDIDLIALFDDSRYPPSEVLEARTRFVKLTRSLVKLLSENTADGYGFRVDLRLRPSPSTTPVCMAMDAAERYYESVGRTWERAAHIKARPLIDPAAGQAYLDRLAPFIWRRHLDFAALEDVTEMLRKIRSQKGPFPAGSLPGQDIKLGPGGVREIEFFAQTRQLILGGRNPLLRVRPTMDALSALADAGEISADHANALTAHLTALRTWEHRFQMLEDAQTHTVPKSAEARSRVAALSGFASAEAFQADLAAHMAGTHSLTEAFFTPAGSDDPDANAMPTETTLSELGFAEPARAAAVIQRWHNGQIPATRGERSQRLYAGLEETIIQQLGKAASPDQALIQFDRFLSGLPAGVQVFSLFTANLQLLSLIVEICAAAPRLAAYLGRCAQVLDALLDRDFWEPLAGEAALHSDLQDRLKQGQDYEARLDIARRWARELWFRTGVQVLRGIADAAEAGRAFTAIATASIRALLPEVTANFAERHGSPPGHDLAVLALGKLGSAEMTAGSDLDLIIIYDAEGAEESDGPKPLAASVYYPRLTQALIAALTAPTAEGAMYEVDMRLRPSGRQGPVAVSLRSFQKYQTEEAWVWEHMALSRARVIAGPDALQDRIRTVRTRALAARKGSETVMSEAREMRGRLIEANARSRSDNWSLKHAAGGLMEIEFLTQTGALCFGLSQTRAAAEALPALTENRWLSEEDAASLDDALTLQSTLQQIERVALDAPLDPETIGPALSAVMVRATGCADFPELSDRLASAQSTAAEIVQRIYAED